MCQAAAVGSFLSSKDSAAGQIWLSQFLLPLKTHVKVRDPSGSAADLCRQIRAESQAWGSIKRQCADKGKHEGALRSGPGLNHMLLQPLWSSCVRYGITASMCHDVCTMSDLCRTLQRKSHLFLLLANTMCSRYHENIDDGTFFSSWFSPKEEQKKKKSV